jgi:DNA-binding NarL/FixJ family response regulator
MEHLPLTPREYEVLCLLMQGKQNKAIADELHIQVSTVEEHLSNIYRKLGVKSRTEAVLVTGRYRQITSD